MQRGKGFVLLPVALAIALVAAVALLSTREAGVGLNVAAGQLEGTQAEAVAEAGLNHSLWQLSQNTTCTGYANIPSTGFGGGNYTVTVSPDNASPVLITAAGSLANGVTRTRTRSDVRVNQAPVNAVLQPGAADGIDAEIWQQSPNNNYGTAKETWVSSATNDTTRTLLSFNLDTIPPGVGILQANLSLDRKSGSGSNEPITAHRILNSWSEDSVTWNQRETGTNWDTAGVDYESMAVTTTLVGPANGRYEWNIAPLVQGWVDGVYPNNGVVLVAGIAGMAGHRFNTSDENSSSKWPSLSISYACECGKTCVTGVDPALIAHWKFDETSGTIAVDSAGSHDGTLENGPVWTAGGKLDGALDFDGANDRVVAPHHANLAITEAITLTAWVQNQSTPIASTYRVISKEASGQNDAYWLALSGGSMFAGFGGGTYTPSNIFVPNQWYHLAATYDSVTAQVKLFVDGSLVLTQAAGTTLNANTADVIIGDNSWEAKEWDGLLDDVRIYNRALDDTEISDLYDAGSGLVAYLKLDETSGTNAQDSIGSHDGTLINGPAWDTNGQDNGALEFDESDDYAYIADFDFATDFTVSFGINMTTNNGSLFKYMYSHGDINGSNSLNVFLTEGSHGTDPNKLRTVIRDSNDTLSNTALEFDVAGIIGDGNWHTYTLTVESGVGAKVYLDGVQQNTDSRGGDAFDPSGNIFLGARQDLNADRRYGGLLDNVRIYDRALTAGEVADLAGAPATGLIAHWKLDDASGTSAIDSVGSHNGTLVNGPSWTTGNIDGALSFDGSNDHIDVPHDSALSLLDKMSFTAWVNSASIGGLFQTILDKDSTGSASNYTFAVDGDELTFGFFSGGTFRSVTTSGENLVSDTWYHLAATFDNATDEVRLYVDGTLSTTGSITQAPTAVTGNLKIGRSATFSEFWNGTLDDVRIYNTLLSGTEIAVLASGGGGSGGGGSCNGTYRDDFSSVGFSGDNGGLSWGNDWTEVGESDGAGSGDVQVMNDISNYQLRLRDNDNSGEGVERIADLAGAASAELRFDYRRVGLDATSDYIAIMVSSTGTGGPWTELDRIEGGGTDGIYQSFNIALTPYISSTTAIRLITSPGMGNNDAVFIDNLSITCTP